MIETIIFIIEIIGIVSFAISGSVVAIDKEMDFVGVIFLSVITCFGGGIMRDLVIGRIPAFFSSMFLFISVCLATSLLVFVFAAAFKKWYFRKKTLIMKLNNYIDALGIGAFSVSSVKICLDYFAETPAKVDVAFISIILGMLAAIGGGMIRDICLRDIPFVFRKHIYAVAALCGSVLYYVISVNIFGGTEVGEIVASIVGIISVFTIRVLATTFKWNMPKAFTAEKMENENELVHK